MCKFLLQTLRPKWNEELDFWVSLCLPTQPISTYTCTVAACCLGGQQLQTMAFRITSSGCIEHTSASAESVFRFPVYCFEDTPHTVEPLAHLSSVVLQHSNQCYSIEAVLVYILYCVRLSPKPDRKGVRRSPNYDHLETLMHLIVYMEVNLVRRVGGDILVPYFEGSTGYTVRYVVGSVANVLPPLLLVKVVGAEFSVILDVMDENVLVSHIHALCVCVCVLPPV